MDKPYSGHRNWNHWNVSLWLNNDERLYREMIHFIGYAKRKSDAARMMAESLRSIGTTHTPDGAPFTKTSIRAAMRGWEY
jgi:hypothetical protein